MNQEAIIALGAMAGAFVAAFGAIVVIAWRLWKGLEKLLEGTASIGGSINEALGSPRSNDSDVPGASDPYRRAHRSTGSFQTIVRDELEGHLAPIEERLKTIETATHENTDLIAQLSRGHNTVAAKTAEHSAKLNMAEAEQTMSGRVPG